MSTSTSESVADQKLIDVALYTIWDAAHYLHLSPWAAIFLSDRGKFPPHSEWFYRQFHRRFPHLPLVDGTLTAQESPWDRERLSFRRLAEMFVRAFAFQGLMELGQRAQLSEGRWMSLQEAVWRSPDEGAVFGREVVSEEVSKRLLAPLAQQLEQAHFIWLEKSLLMRLERVEQVEGVPLRLYPFSRVPSANSPRSIVLDPRIRFGRPTIVERGVATDILFERHQAGDSVAELAEDYDITSLEVEEAIRYEATPRDVVFPFPGW